MDSRQRSPSVVRWFATRQKAVSLAQNLRWQPHALARLAAASLTLSLIASIHDAEYYPVRRIDNGRIAHTYTSVTIVCRYERGTEGARFPSSVG